MKKMLLLVVLVIGLTGCGVVSSQPSDRFANTSDETTQLSLKLTEYDTVGAGNFQLTEGQAKYLDEHIRRIQPEEIESCINKDFLLEGFNVSVSDIEKVDNINISFKTTFTNDKGKSCTVPMGARIDINVFYPNSDKEELKWETKELICDIRHCSGDQLIINRHSNPLQGDILFFDADTMKQLNIKADLSRFSDCHILDIVKRNNGHVFIYASDKREGFALIDNKGNITDYALDGFDASTSLLDINYRPDLSKTSMNYAPWSDRMLKYLDDRQNYIIYQYYRGGFGNYLFSFADNKCYFVGEVIETVENGNCSVEIRKRDEYIKIGRPDTQLLTVTREKGKDTTVAFISGDMGDVLSYDGDAMSTSTSKDDNADKIIIENSVMEQTLTIDIPSGKMYVDYHPTERRLDYEFAKSSDGIHSLWKGNSYGGGDISYEQIILKNNKTGQLKYIDTIGGMYGGSESAGFFSNGDVYTIGLGEFKVFTTDMSQEGPVFEMSKNFSLGSGLKGDIYFRHLLAARRDPSTHSWVVLYNEAPYEADANNWYLPGDLGDNFYKSTYKIGILDPQGKLTKVYDTGEYVMTYSFRTVEMYMKPGNIIHFSVLFKGTSSQLEAELDLNTGKYTCISGGYNEWIKNQ